MTINGRRPSFDLINSMVHLENKQETIFVTLHMDLVGGKGGFGSMLRAIGAQIEKTTNKEACRDLSGRRIRDVNIERRFRNWVAKAAERKKEQMRRKKERLEKLRRVPKFEFRDEEYFKVRSEMPQKIDDALEYAMQKTKHKTGLSATTTSAALQTEPSPLSANDKKCTQPFPVKRKFLTKIGLSKKSRVWINDDLDVSDDEELKTEAREDVSENPMRQEDNPTNNETIINSKIEPYILSEPESRMDATVGDPKPETLADVVPDHINLDTFNCKEELAALGLDRLKSGLRFLGMKCGGTLEQRVERLWSVRGVRPGEIPKNLLAIQSKK